MITVISNEKEILKCQKNLQKELFAFLDKGINGVVGYPGGSYENEIRYSSRLGIWYTHALIEGNRHWNGFGTGLPNTKNNSLVAEINFPTNDINRAIAAVFAKDENKNILILHRGKIGGGKKSVGKQLFWEKYRGERVYANDGEQVTEFAYIAQLGSAFLGRGIADFIFEVQRIKNISNYEIPSLSGLGFTEESVNSIEYERKGHVSTVRTHGIIVNALERELHKIGLNVDNDKSRDLFSYSNGKVDKIFEIKTRIDSQSIYTAVGQLICYSFGLNNPKLEKYLVLPEKIKVNLENELLKYQINTIYYELKGDTPIFKDLKNKIKY